MALDELQAAARATPEEMEPGEPGSLGDRPLIVLSAGKSTQDATWQAGWAAAQTRLAALSARGIHLVAENNGHSIALENPKLVSAAVEAVVRAVRGERFDVSEVR